MLTELFQRTQLMQVFEKGGSVVAMAEAIRVEAKLVRSTPLAAGVEFRAEDRMFRCWVWANAVHALDDEPP